MQASVVLERGLCGQYTGKTERWKEATLSVCADLRVLEILVKKDLKEFPLADFSFHYSHVAEGKLTLRYAKKDFQLLVQGNPLQMRQLAQEVFAVTQECKRKRITGRGYDTAYAATAPKRRKLDEADKRMSAKVVNAAFEGIDTLSEEQRKVCEAVLDGENVFFTGGAGTGKSFLLQQLLKLLDPDVTAVTASTALSACQIGGMTIHQWSGVGRGEGDVATLAAQLKGKREALQRWRSSKTLVIDEISMVDGRLFEKLDVLSRVVRKDKRPFGGLQLVLCGDFLQLPPVSRRDDDGVKFCFEVMAWRKGIQRTFVLTEIFRQQGDRAFCDVLNEVRRGHLSTRGLKLLRTRLVAGSMLGTSNMVRLMSLRSEVERVNDRELSLLKGDPLVFSAVDNGPPDLDFDKMCMAKRVVALKKGAQVILIKTLDAHRKLVNGTKGRVIDFVGSCNLARPVVLFQSIGVQLVIGPEVFEVRMEKRLIGTRMQLPLDLGWAVSIHKSQGMTLDEVEMGLGTIFEDGQTYVALSRARKLDGLHLIGEEDQLQKAVRANPKCVRFYDWLQQEEKRDTQQKENANTQDNLMRNSQGQQQIETRDKNLNSPESRINNSPESHIDNSQQQNSLAQA